jgi:hypothetical protein
MKANIGTADRAVRIVIGLIIVSLAFWGPKSPWAYIGLLPIFTGIFGYCGLYTLLGVNTCKRTA